MTGVETATLAEERPKNSRSALPTLPEPGQVVEVRGSTWAVANVQAQGLPRSPADEATAQLSHVVDLQSLDEDRLGEQLSVVWELEVGHTVTTAQGLPDVIYADAFDAPATLAGFIDAMRWGAVTSADPNRYQAPFWSGVNVEAYQLEPLRRALGAPRANLLLADDVGLGKTIEAGLVIQELFLRHRARTAVIVCPPSLALKWQDEMREKFGLEFTIVNSELMAQVRRTHGLHANPFQLFPRVIVSMAWLPQLRAQRLLRDVYAQASNPKTGNRFAFDILVVDEAHHVAPSSPSAIAGGRGYAVDTQRTVAVRQLADKCEQAVLSSSLHQLWAITYGSGMRNDPRYTPSDVFETFPRPTGTAVLECVGQALDQERREIMLRRELGLTKLYNLVNDSALPDSIDRDVARLRQIHVELDRAVLHAYGWTDVDLGHGFHRYRKMERWTICPAARVEILDRLLEENHRRASAEEPAGRVARKVEIEFEGATLFD